MKRSPLQNLLLCCVICCALIAAIVGIGRWRSARLDRRLIYATEVGNLASMREMIEAGARVNQPVKDKFTKPTPATYFKNALRGKLHDFRRAETTPLMVAVATGRIEAARLLLDHGAQVDARDEYGFTSLIMAISMRRPDMGSLMLDYGANPNAANQMNMPPLLWALMLHQTESACLLLDHGADPNARDADNIPALYLAVLEEDVRTTQSLLAHGADPNTSFGGCTSLQLAVLQHDREITLALMQKGARSTIVRLDRATLADQPEAVLPVR